MSHTWRCDGGNLQKKGETDGQRRWERVAMGMCSFHFGQSLTVPEQFSQHSEPRQEVRSQTLSAFFSCIMRRNNCCSPPSHTLQGFLSLCLFMKPWRASPRAWMEKRPRRCGHRWAARSLTVWRGGGEDLSFPSQHRSVYTRQEFSEVSRRGPDS